MRRKDMNVTDKRQLANNIQNLEDDTMMYNNIDFDTYFKNYPDEKGYFGKYGGSYIPPELQTAMNEISEAYQTICKSRKFISELRRIRKEFQGRPTPISHLARLSDRNRSPVVCKTRRFKPYRCT